MPITFDNATSASGDPVAEPFEYLHTCSGDDLVLIVGVTHNGSRTTDSITYDGVPLSQIITITDGFQHAELWYLVNPNTGSHTVSISLSGSSSGGSGAISLNGVDTADAIGNSASNSGVSTSASVGVVTTKEDSWIVDCLMDFVQVPTAASGQEARWSESYSNQKGNGSTRIATDIDTYTMSWTFAFASWALVAVEIKAKVAEGGKLINQSKTLGRRLISSNRS